MPGSQGRALKKTMPVLQHSGNRKVSLDVLGIGQLFLVSLLTKGGGFHARTREKGSEDKWGYSFKELTPFSDPAERSKRIEVSLLSCHEILLISDLIVAPELISGSLTADCRRICLS